MYIEKKKIKGKEYYYASISVRSGNTVKSKTVAYLGSTAMKKQDIQKAMQKISKEKIQKAKNELKETMNQKEEFLNSSQLQKLEQIKSIFTKKMLSLDKALLQDMFRDFKTHYIYNTNAIEGNTISFKETDLLLNANKTPAGKDLREVHDHLNASTVFDYLLKYKPEITKDLIIKIHSMLLENIDVRRGSFRFHNVRVIGSTFETSDARYVETDMKLLLEWYHKNERKLHPLVLAALFHEKFERIHPFYDGNGRTGRMLLNLILLRFSFPPLIVLNKERMQYYKALDTGHKADLFSSDLSAYGALIEFCYTQLLKTWEELFIKWG